MDYRSLSSTLVTRPRRGSVLLEISDFLLHAWPPLAAGRNIVLLHPFSLHFLFVSELPPLAEFTKVYSISYPYLIRCLKHLLLVIYDTEEFPSCQFNLM